MTVTATLTLDVSADGLFQDVPAGSKIQIVTGAGVCAEVALPSNASQTLATAKRLALPPIDVPTKAAATVDRCPAPGERFTIALLFPSGSSIALVTTIWSPGAASVEFAIPAPHPQSEGTQPRLPSAGQGSASNTVTAMLVALSLLLAGMGAHLTAGLLGARRAR
jgi:hypothetical protein